MASWRDVVTHLRANHPRAVEEMEYVGLGFGAQSVVVRRADVRGARVMILADVCPARLVALGLVVAMNRDLVIGSLIVVGDMLAIRHILRLETLALGDLDEAVVSLRDDGRLLRERAAAARVPAAALEIYAD